MDPVERAKQLAEDIRTSAEYLEYHRKKDSQNDDSAIISLLKECRIFTVSGLFRIFIQL